MPLDLNNRIFILRGKWVGWKHSELFMFRLTYISIFVIFSPTFIADSIQISLKQSKNPLKIDSSYIFTLRQFSKLPQTLKHETFSQQNPPIPKSLLPTLTYNRNTIEKIMGCQHSRLTLLENQNINNIPASSLPQEKKKSIQRSKIYECKQNIDIDEMLKPKQKEIQSHSLHIFDEQEQKVKGIWVNPKEVEIVAAAVKKIQEFQSAQRSKRIQKHLKAKSKADFEAYFAQIVTMLKKKKEIFDLTLQQASQKYLSVFNRNATPQDVDRLILTYLKTKATPYFEVQRWMKEKIVITRIKGQELAKWITEICSTWTQDIELIPQILHALIQDSSKTDKSFNMKISLQYEHKNTLVEVQEWQEQMLPIYHQLSDILE